MAQSFDVNLTFTSYIGYRQVYGSIIGSIPRIQTIHTLEGVDIAPEPYPPIPLLRVEPLSNFVFQPNTTSSVQVVRMTNIGGYVLTVTNISFSYYDVVPKIPVGGLTLPITIQPNNTGTFSLKYTASLPGQFSNYFTIYSNAATGPYRFITNQNVGYEFGFIINPSGYTTSTSHIGENLYVTYDLITTSTDPNNPDVIPTETSMTGSPAWSITSTGTNFVSVNFNPNEVNNVNGIYESVLTVKSNNVVRSVTNTATIAIDYNKNIHLNSWLSPASHYNSIIGMSYDIIESQRVLTIGVGMGGDGIPIYGYGGSVYANTTDLGLGANTTLTPYTFWSKVYRIPFTGEAKEYYSTDYVVKTTTASDYSSYFGEYHAPESMFIVEDDGYGSLKIEINHLRDIDPSDITVSDELKATLNNLTRAFYYYSNVDILGRYEPLPAEYSSPISSNTATTSLFIGFNYNTRDKLADINTSIVVLPT